MHAANVFISCKPQNCAKICLNVSYVCVQLNVAEEAQTQLSRDLQRVTQEKLELQNQLASLGLECDAIKESAEQHGRDKWELTQVFTKIPLCRTSMVIYNRHKSTKYLLMFCFILCARDCSPSII